MTVNSSANSVILILFAFSDNLSAENSKSSADFCIQLIQLLECMILCLYHLLFQAQAHRPTMVVMSNGAGPMALRIANPTIAKAVKKTNLEIGTFQKQDQN